MKNKFESIHDLLQHYEQVFRDAFKEFGKLQRDIEDITKYHDNIATELKSLKDNSISLNSKPTNAILDKMIFSIAYVASIPFAIKVEAKSIINKIKERRVFAASNNLDSRIILNRNQFLNIILESNHNHEKLNEHQQGIMNLLVYNFTLSKDIDYTKKQITNNKIESFYFVRMGYLIIYETLQDMPTLLKPFYSAFKNDSQITKQLVNVSRTCNEMKSDNHQHLRDIRVTIVAHRDKSWNNVVNSYMSLNEKLILRLFEKFKEISISLDILLILMYRRAWNIITISHFKQQNVND